MVRSTACFVGTSLASAPAWLLDFRAIPHSVQVAWVAGVLGLVLLGGFFWAKDGK